MNLSQSEIRNREYRHGLVAAQIEIDLPLQLRALRKQRGWTQPEMAERTGMKQSRFPVMEKPGGARFNLDTIRRLAEALDVAVIVRFAPFSELVDWSNNFNPDTFTVPSFEEELGIGDAGAIHKVQSMANRRKESEESQRTGSALDSVPQGLQGGKAMADYSLEPTIAIRKEVRGATSLVREDSYGDHQGTTWKSGLAL